MHDAPCVSGLERQGHLRGHSECLARLERPSCEALGEVLARDELHRDEVRAFLPPVECVDRRDVPVVQGGEQTSLAREAREAVAVGGQRFRKHLDRDLAIQLGVQRLPDHAHPALADLLDESVLQ